jgi:hypothetical protein
MGLGDDLEPVRARSADKIVKQMFRGGVFL